MASLIGVNVKPTLTVGNEAAIKQAENPEFHRRTEHIFIIKLVTKRDYMVKKV